MAVSWINVTRLFYVLALVPDIPADTDAEDLTNDNILSPHTS